MMYEIKNMNGFAKSLGRQVAKHSNFTKAELKEYINVGNIKNIIKKYANHKKGSDKYYIDEKRTFKACDEIHDWLVGVNLAKLAALDMIDCYWDNQKNEMVFFHRSKDLNGGKDDLA